MPSTRLLFGMLALVGLATPQVRAGEAALPRAPFRVLDRVLGPHVNLNPVPATPLALSADGRRLAAVNTHGNRVRVFGRSDDDRWRLEADWPTAWGPSSCAWWESAPAEPGLLVTCSLSDALLYLARDGTVERLVHLPTEPTDLLVDETRDVAWVACSGADTVVEVDLRSGSLRARYPIPSKHPRALAFERGATGTVLVAPLISGNDSIVERGREIFNAGPRGLLDLRDAPRGLPDHDLFRLDPADGSVEPVVRRAGTILLDLARHPRTNAIWIVGTDARNTEFLGEPSARSRFSENRLAIVPSLPRRGDAPALPDALLDLDDHDPTREGAQTDRSRSVGQPCALAFDADGDAFVAGLLSDNVSRYGPDGALVREWDVGSIPRALLWSEFAGRGVLFVYCWGSNTVELWSTGGEPTRLGELDLGPDPSHPALRAGRELYYSGANSEHANSSCNTCHVDGFADLIAWDLSDRRLGQDGAYSVPVDDKGPLVTQTLRSIEGRNPYHWRGEREDLVDFNPAFPGLLGGAPLDTAPGGEFDRFAAFVFSLQERANPFQSLHREVSDAFVPGGLRSGTSAVRGQELYFDREVLERSTCQDCHSLPSGTANATFRDEIEAPLAERSHFANPPLLSLWRRLTAELTEVEFSDGRTDSMPILGTGLAATGLAHDALDFISHLGTTLEEEELEDVGAYVVQLDSGLAPLVHRAVALGGKPAPAPATLAVARMRGAPEARRPLAPGTLVTPESATGPGADRGDAAVLDLLLERAGPDDLDLLLVATRGGEQLRGHYRVAERAFELADGGRLAADELRRASRTGALKGMVYPVPAGLGLRLLPLDPPEPDVREAADRAELRAWTQRLRREAAEEPLPEPTAEGPVVSDVELVFVTARVAKLVFRTDVPAISVTQYAGVGPTGAPIPPRRRLQPLPTREHTVLLRDLRAVSTWSARVLVTDLEGRTTEYVLDVPFRTKNLLIQSHVVADELGVRSRSRDSGGVLEFEAEVSVKKLVGAPAARFTPVFDVLASDVRTGAWRTVYRSFAAVPTDLGGRSFVRFRVEDLREGDQVLVRIADIRSPVSDEFEWSLPDTPAEARLVELAYTGEGP